MHFIAAAALFSGVAMAQVGFADNSGGSTTYSTKYYTVTACEPTVSDCPGSVTSDVMTMTTDTVYSTQVNTVTDCPDDDEDNCTTGVETSSVSVSETLGTYEPDQTLTTAPYPTDECPSVSVRAITTSITKVVPHVIYETIDLPPCETTTPSSGVPSPTGSPQPSQPVFTGAADTAGVSIAAVFVGALALLA